MSNIAHKSYLAFSTLGSVSQKGKVIEKLSDNTYLLEVTEQHGQPDFYWRVASVQEITTFRLYDKGWQRDNAADEINEAYQKRIEEQAKLNAEEAAKNDKPINPEQN